MQIRLSYGFTSIATMGNCLTKVCAGSPIERSPDAALVVHKRGNKYDCHRVVWGRATVTNRNGSRRHRK
jgi:hypothetical protein